MASREQDVFESVIGTPRAERDALVERKCGGDAILASRVRELLASYDAADGFLATPTGEGPVCWPAEAELLSGASTPIAEGPGAKIGRYRLLQVIGEGGFGVVFMAEQSEPIRRRVAIKVIKLGMDTRQVIARFEAERQALAMMDHPNIARVLDAGATATGRPYFVMELVAGVPITEYADKNALGMRERLELLIPVCHAVQHAHHKGVIHRDLKPSNVLVTLQDGKPVPKVIDFGIAKAVNHRLTERTLFTEFRQLIGTPEYMSPEQADMPGLDVDTRSDVYSLGVLMYELLVGATPLDATSLRSQGFAEMQRTIRESDPPRPANRFATLGAQREEVARRRRSDAAALSRELVGEPEWVVMKCLERDRTRRYDTTAALAEDIGRMLRSEPVRAAPPSRAYAIRKFVRRHRRQVVLGLVVTGLFLGGLAGTSIGMTWALRAKQAEQERADQLKKVLDFQVEMFGQIDMTKAGVELINDVREQYTAALKKAGGPEAEYATRAEAMRLELGRVNATDIAKSMIDRTILKPAIKTIDEQFKDKDPKTDASLRQALAVLYRTIGLYDAAMPLQESALATRRSELKDEHRDTLSSISNMGLLLRAKGKSGDAEPFLQTALDKRRLVLGDEDPDTLHSLNNMGGLLRAKGRRDEAEKYWSEALKKRRRVLGEEHPDTLTSIGNMGLLLKEQGKLGEAELYYSEALEKSRRVLGEEHQATLTYINNLGPLLKAQGKLDEAEQYYREALGKRRRVLGEEHPDTLVSMNNLGSFLLDRGKLKEAEPFLSEALEKRRRVLDEGHPATLLSINNMGALRREQGRLEEAGPLFREAMDKRRRFLKDEHPDTLNSVSSMARLKLDQGRAQEAFNLIAPFATFEPAARKAFKGDNAPRLADYLVALGRPRAGVGYDAQRFALAEANLLEAYPLYLAAPDRGRAHKDKAECVQALVDLYTTWHAAEPGKGYDEKAAEWRAKLPATEAEQK